MEQNLHNMDENFEKKIKDKLQDATMSPPAHIWSNISMELNRQEAIPSAPINLTKNNTAKKIGQYSIAASIVFLLGFGVALKFFNNEKTTTTATATKNDNLPATTNTIAKSEESNNIITPATPIAANNTVSQKKSVRSPKAATQLIKEDNLSTLPTNQENTAIATTEKATEAIQATEVTPEKSTVNAMPIAAPIFSAKVLEKEEIHDEIKVLEDSNDAQKDTKNKVIVIERKNKKPTINYVLPWRF